MYFKRGGGVGENGGGGGGRGGGGGGGNTDHVLFEREWGMGIVVYIFNDFGRICKRR